MAHSAEEVFSLALKLSLPERIKLLAKLGDLDKVPKFPSYREVLDGNVIHDVRSVVSSLDAVYPKPGEILCADFKEVLKNCPLPEDVWEQCFDGSDGTILTLEELFKVLQKWSVAHRVEAGTWTKKALTEIKSKFSKTDMHHNAPSLRTSREKTVLRTHIPDPRDAFAYFCQVTSPLRVLHAFKMLKDALNKTFGRFDLVKMVQSRVGKLGALVKSCDIFKTSVPLRPEAVVLGAGPCGLRLAIELRMQGFEVVVLEKYSEDAAFERFNALKLWDWLSYDLRKLGGEDLLPRFFVYWNHIGIRELQSLLLKVCLLLGVNVLFGEEFSYCHMSSQIEGGADKGRGAKKGKEKRMRVASKRGNVIHERDFDILCGCDSKNSKLASNVMGLHQSHDHMQETFVALVVNFQNCHKQDDYAVELALAKARFGGEHWIDGKEVHLHETIVYFAGETHYFIIAPSVTSLQNFGVFHEVLDLVPSGEQGRLLLSTENVDMKALEHFSRQVVSAWLEHCNALSGEEDRAPDLFSKLPLMCTDTERKKPAMSVFSYSKPPGKTPEAMMMLPQKATRTEDFASSSSLDDGATCTKKRQLVMIAGDALQEPYWPNGEGIGRGFLAVLDTAWIAQHWAQQHADDDWLNDTRQELHNITSSLSEENIKSTNLESCYEKFLSHPETRYDASMTVRLNLTPKAKDKGKGKSKGKGKGKAEGEGE